MEVAIMTDKHEHTDTSASAERVERRTQGGDSAAGLTERRRFGKGFAPLDKSQLSTEEAMKAYLGLLQERRESNPKS